MDRTENSLIFVERDKPLSPEEMAEKLEILRAALKEGDEEGTREALMRVVPTYRPPGEEAEQLAALVQ